MREAQSGVWSAGRAFLGLAALAALAPPARPYVNGGDYYNTLRTFEKRLKAGGWAVRCGTPMPGLRARGREADVGVSIHPPDNPEYRHWVNRMVARALSSLPPKEAEKVSDETKRRLAELTRDAIRDAVRKEREVIKNGRVGSLQYQVGAYEFASWWETRYGGKLKIHAKRKGLAPFVALKVVGAKDRDGE